MRNGLIGKINRVEVGPARGPRRHMAPVDMVPDPPPELDYEMWIGPSKMMPYIRAAFTGTGAGTTTPAAAS